MKKLRILSQKIETKLLEWYEPLRQWFLELNWEIEEKFSYLREIGIKMWIFRRIVYSWNDDKILKSLINRQFAIIGEPVPKEAEEYDVDNWFDYLVKSHNDTWYKEYRFKNSDQKKEFMLYFYEVMKLRKHHFYFPSDHYLDRGWPWFSLEYGFSYDGEFESKEHFGLLDLPIHEFWWFKMFNWLYKFEDLSEEEELSEEIEDEESDDDNSKEYIEEEMNQLVES